MPDLTGLELSKQLNAEANSFKFPTLLMSDALQHQVIPGDCYEAFFKKPVMVENLFIEIREMLGANDYSPSGKSTELR